MEIGLISGISAAAFLFALFLVNNVLSRDTKTADMQRISNGIKESAAAFPARQNKIIATITVAVALLLFELYGFKTVIYS